MRFEYFCEDSLPWNRTWRKKSRSLFHFILTWFLTFTLEFNIKLKRFRSKFSFVFSFILMIKLRFLCLIPPMRFIFSFSFSNFVIMIRLGLLRAKNFFFFCAASFETALMLSSLWNCKRVWEGECGRIARMPCWRWGYKKTFRFRFFPPHKHHVRFSPLFIFRPGENVIWIKFSGWS